MKKLWNAILFTQKCIIWTKGKISCKSNNSLYEMVDVEVEPYLEVHS